MDRHHRRGVGRGGDGAEGAPRCRAVSGDITVDELREAVAHFAVYQGYPRATVLSAAIEEAWARLQQDGAAG